MHVVSKKVRAANADKQEDNLAKFGKKERVWWKHERDNKQAMWTTEKTEKNDEWMTEKSAKFMKQERLLREIAGEKKQKERGTKQIETVAAKKETDSKSAMRDAMSQQEKELASKSAAQAEQQMVESKHKNERQEKDEVAVERQDKQVQMQHREEVAKRMKAEQAEQGQKHIRQVKLAQKLAGMRNAGAENPDANTPEDRGSALRGKADDSSSVVDRTSAQDPSSAEGPSASLPDTVEEMTLPGQDKRKQKLRASISTLKKTLELEQPLYHMKSALSEFSARYKQLKADMDQTSAPGESSGEQGAGGGDYL